ncbi:MAG TPA: PDZ domain-containing protein [Pyrinomonadaceae bacterium]|jgi:hypothetical protein|nr:PDZ domain-containing protein [Pyrinomonadaceae bacterium]
MRTRVVIVVTLYALVALFTAAAYYLYLPQYTIFHDRGWGTRQIAGGPVVVAELYERNPDAGQLRVGDEVVAFDGEDILSSDSRLESAYHRALNARPGEPYRMTVRRDGGLREFTLGDEGPEAARLAGVIRRALSKDPARRFQSAEEMRRELVSALRACPPIAGPALDADTMMLLDPTRMKG